MQPVLHWVTLLLLTAQRGTHTDLSSTAMIIGPLPISLAVCARLATSLGIVVSHDQCGSSSQSCDPALESTLVARDNPTPSAYRNECPESHANKIQHFTSRCNTRRLRLRRCCSTGLFQGLSRKSINHFSAPDLLIHYGSPFSLSRRHCWLWRPNVLERNEEGPSDSL
jgi:hypothetical protein